MYPLKAGRAPLDRINSSAIRSNSETFVPDTICFSSMISVSATIWQLFAIFSISRCVRVCTITSASVHESVPGLKIHHNAALINEIQSAAEYQGQHRQ